MNTAFLQSQDKARIGNDAGWVLEFFHERSGNLEPHPELRFLRIEDYYADIQADLVSCEHNQVRSGLYTFTIEGLIDEHYRILSLNNKDRPTVVKLYLYWRDTIASIGGYLSSFVGLTELGKLSEADLQDALVAVLTIKRVTREVGSRRYETKIQAEERVFNVLSRQVKSGACMESPRNVLQEIENRTHIRIHFFAPQEQSSSQGDTNPVPQPAYLEDGRAYRDTISEMANAMEEATGKYGRGMLLIRDGDLYCGLRNIPLDSKPKWLSQQNGLIEAKPDTPSDADLYFDRSNGERPPHLTHFKLILKGRPDLKPGDVVVFNCPPEDEATTAPGIGDALLGIAGPVTPEFDQGFTNPVMLYINSVNHRLSRTSGFVTIVMGVSIPGLAETEVWDSQSPAGSRPASRSATSPAASGSAAAAQSVQQVAERVVNSRYFADVGEVRQMHTQGQGSRNEPPGQTLRVFRGLAASDGGESQASRLAIHPNPLPSDRVAYATPFAWGKCGLVLPRYPGTRVMLVHRHGQRNDPVEMGALWEYGHGPASQAGDWWLILPVGILPESERAVIADDATPEEHTGQVSQDLIDAEGNRIIEVGELTIRVGKENLKNAGERPDRPDDEESITIEHAEGGSRIVMKQNGDVVITAKNIELDAGNGNITMKANKVDVQVSDAMNVLDKT